MECLFTVLVNSKPYPFSGSTYSHQVHKVPSVVQVRFKGCKGTLILDPNLGKGIKIRPSLEKFKWNSVDSPPPYMLGN